MKKMNLEKKKVKIYDNTGNINIWIIYGETEYTYKVYAECDRSYITEIHKSKVQYFEDDFYYEIYCTEIKNPFSLLPEWYAKAEFCEIKLDM
jgi:hypothetical protein